MKKDKITFITLSIITFLLYAGMAFWLYFQDKADSTGWASIGIIAFALTMVFPGYSILGGIAGQLLMKKVWLFPVINAAGSALFILVVFLTLGGEVEPIALVIVPAVFLVTFIVSVITMFVQKAIGGKKQPASIPE
ncbi:MAG: hypothetical protein ACYC5K_00130 [Saccharofermentanales bacterium]